MRFPFILRAVIGTGISFRGTMFYFVARSNSVCVRKLLTSMSVYELHCVLTFAI
jgi:hypothetical protein